MLKHQLSATQDQEPAYMKEVRPGMHRRARYHDYAKAGFYMVTLVVEGRRPLLGELRLDGTPEIALSELGKELYSGVIPSISHYNSMVRVVKSCIMPDHIHLILHVMGDLPENMTLGYVIRGFKIGCNRDYRKIFGFKSGRLFEDNFTDSLIKRQGQVDAWALYLDDNPRRLAIKRRCPEFFTTLAEKEIGGRICQLFGNSFLLDVPDKMAVIVHHADTMQDFYRMRREWLECGARGGVLVGTGVGPREKEVLNEAFLLGYRIIQLCKSGFPPLYKPAGRSFDACARGSLLQISPWPYTNRQQPITRAQCLELNALAEALATRPNS